MREFLILIAFQIGEDEDELELENIDETTFELALALWNMNSGKYSKDFKDDENLDKEEFLSIVKSCKTIIAE